MKNIFKCKCSRIKTIPLAFIRYRHAHAHAHTDTHTWRTQNTKLSRRGWGTMCRVLPALVFFGYCCHLVAISCIIVLWLRINCVPLLGTDSRKFWFQPEHEPVRNKEDSRRRHVGCGSVSGQRDTHEDRHWTGSRIQVELEFTPNHLGFVASFLHLMRKKIPQNPFPLFSRYYIAVLTLISFSLILQIVAGVLIIIIGEPITLQLLQTPVILVPNHPY